MDEGGTEKSLNELHDDLLKEITLTENKVFRRPVYLFRHKSRPVRLLRVEMKISRAGGIHTPTGYKVSCSTANNTPVLCHWNVEPEVTVYKNSVTWSTKTECYPSDG